MEYATSNPLASESEYPYTSGTGRTGRCDASKLGNGEYSVTGIHKVIPNQSASMKAAIAQGPISVTV